MDKTNMLFSGQLKTSLSYLIIKRRESVEVGQLNSNLGSELRALTLTLPRCHTRQTGNTNDLNVRPACVNELATRKIMAALHCWRVCPPHSRSSSLLNFLFPAPSQSRGNVRCRRHEPL